MRSVKPESLLQRDCLSGPWAWHPAARGIDWDAVLRPLGFQADGGKCWRALPLTRTVT